MIIFIPSDDYAEDASDADTIDSLAYEFIQSGHLETRSIRIGNIGAETVTYSLITRQASAADVTIDFDSATLAPDEISDTTTITIEVPPEAISIGHVFDIVAVVDTSEYELEVTYEAVGANDDRRPQYPDRASSFTDQASNTLDRFSEWFHLLTYLPIAFVPDDPNDRTVLLERTDFVGSTGIRVLSKSDPCERLNPTNETWGYTLSTSMLRGTFVNESREISMDQATGLNYETSAYLVFPAEEELIREWRLFEPARDQYKRTVYVIERQGELYAIENIVPLSMGQILSHFEADLVAIHRKDQNISSRYNPWAMSYRNESDKPTHVWQCPYDLDAILDDIGSNASMGSNLLGSDVS